MMTTRFMRRRLGAMLLAVLIAAFGGQVALAATTPDAAAKSALAWLLGRQQDDGSFQGLDTGASADAIFAIVASGGDPNTVQKSGKSPVAFLETQAGNYATKSAAAAGKLTLAVVAAGKDPRSFGGQNLLDLITKSYDATTGRYGVQTTDHAYALLGLASAGQPIPQPALDAVNALQLPDGGWSFDGAPATGSDTNTTALIIQALAAAKAQGAPVTKAVEYLKTQQNKDGGFPYSQTSQYGADSDANSTAAVIQGLTAAGVDAATLKQGANDPFAALIAFQNQNGALRYQAAMPEDNDLATAQAVPALLLKTYPLVTASLPAAAPAAAPGLPATGGQPQPAWLLAPALVALLAGMFLRARARGV